MDTQNTNMLSVIQVKEKNLLDVKIGELDVDIGFLP